MIDTTNKEARYIITPDGKAWMFGQYENTVTVHFSGDGAGVNKCYQVEKCEEVEK